MYFHQSSAQPSNSASRTSTANEVGRLQNKGPSNQTAKVTEQQPMFVATVTFERLPPPGLQESQNRMRTTSSSNSTSSIWAAQSSSAPATQVTKPRLSAQPRTREASGRNYEVVTLPSPPREQDAFPFGLNNVNYIENDFQSAPVVSSHVLNNDETANFVNESLNEPNNDGGDDSGFCVADADESVTTMNVSQNQVHCNFINAAGRTYVLFVYFTREERKIRKLN